MTLLESSTSGFELQPAVNYELEASTTKKSSSARVRVRHIFSQPFDWAQIFMNDYVRVLETLLANQIGPLQGFL